MFDMLPSPKHTYLMLSFLLWLVFAVLSFLGSAMLVSYALWYWENQKVLDLSKHLKLQNGSILEKGMGKRGFSTFDLSASIQKSKGLAKNIVSGTVTSVQGLARGVQKSGILTKISTGTSRAVSGITTGFGSLIKPVNEQEAVKPQLTQEELKEKNYHEAVDKLIEEATPFEQEIPKVATIDYAKGTQSNQQQNPAAINADDMSLFEKLELRILNRLKETGMENYDIWLELGALYKKFGQYDKAKDVFALVLKHASDKNKEMARNELIGLN